MADRFDDLEKHLQECKRPPANQAEIIRDVMARRFVDPMDEILRIKEEDALIEYLTRSAARKGESFEDVYTVVQGVPPPAEYLEKSALILQKIVAEQELARLNPSDGQYFADVEAGMSDQSNDKHIVQFVESIRAFYKKIIEEEKCVLFDDIPTKEGLRLRRAALTRLIKRLSELKNIPFEEAYLQITGEQPLSQIDSNLHRSSVPSDLVPIPDDPEQGDVRCQALDREPRTEPRYSIGDLARAALNNPHTEHNRPFVSRDDMDPLGSYPDDEDSDGDMEC